TSRPTSRGSARPPGGGRPPASPTASRAPWSGIVSTATATPAELARAIRAHALRMVHRASDSHIGTCLSIADLLAVLYASVLSVGELDEGSTWEAVLFAAHHRLDNLVAMVDYNKIQSFGRVAEVLDLDPLADKWRAFRWGVREIDGHDHATIAAALESVPLEAGRPSVLVAHTVKGKGVSFM